MGTRTFLAHYSVRQYSSEVTNQRCLIGIVAPPQAALSLSNGEGGCYTGLVQAKRGHMLFRVGTSECLIILVVLIIVVGLAYRGGYFRGRRR
jgi:hypothetical protein